MPPPDEWLQGWLRAARKRLVGRRCGSWAELRAGLLAAARLGDEAALMPDGAWASGVLEQLGALAGLHVG